MPESRRVPVREGYDLWSLAYDTTDNPVVALDARETIAILAPVEGEWILDAGCGTGRNLRAIAAAGCPAIGVDFSRGMLDVARTRLPGIPLVDCRGQASFAVTDVGLAICGRCSENCRGRIAGDKLPSR